ncbi:MAG: cyclodeaminase/cyclohydrolase family protein [Clostridia bacterium]|nr:cyclodeaminase/cyclohydrolase family protein [Clostridia bacterium]MBR5717588.1 cyclodeaminase/cyclohydrolase family protein [Clostridia bacterium]
MKLKEMTVVDYMELLGSDAPAPGGGSASALVGAQGVGLFTMVAGLTLGRKKYLDFTDNCNMIIEQGKPIQLELIEQIDRDTEAFNQVSAAFKLPKETDEEKAARKAAIREATIVATKAPFYTIELCHKGIMLGKQLIGKFNTNCASDLGVGALNVKAAAYGAWLNVLINVSGLDEETAAVYKTKGQEMLNEIDAAFDEINAEVMSCM